MNQPPVNSGHFSSSHAPLIYIVDDEPMLLDLAEVALMSDGYRFKKFADPALAFKSFQAETPKPTLLVTDYMMGSMTGLQLLALCRREHPALKVVLVSGTAGPELINESAEPVDHFLPKPYKPRELAGIVRAVLAGQARL